MNPNVEDNHEEGFCDANASMAGNRMVHHRSNSPAQSNCLPVLNVLMVLGKMPMQHKEVHRRNAYKHDNEGE